MEAWRIVPSWPRYEASDAGHVRSVTGRVLRAKLHARGCVCVRLTRGGRRKPVPVAVLVCEAWHGTRPSREHRAVVLDGKRWHLAPSNVAWLTQREAWLDTRAARTRRGRVITAEVARQIAALRPLSPWRGSPAAGSVAAAFAVAPGVVRRIWSGKRWAHAGPPTRDDLEAARLQMGDPNVA